MSEVAKKVYSLEEYLALEATSQEKHEYYNGEIFAMAGGTFRHAQIVENVFVALRQRLKGKPCQPKSSDMRIATPSGLYTYPDASVYCGKPELSEAQTELRNPVVIVEVLSASTRNYDRGEKFRLYRTIGSFREYVLVESESVLVEHYSKRETGEWVLREYTRLTDEVELHAIKENISLQEIYEEVTFNSKAE
ncbi:MAG: Uma2 family endonuclease [Chloroherpetonaceae bacterium]